MITKTRPYRTITLSECKIKAAILFKALRSDDQKTVADALKRFARVYDLSPQMLKLKHALTVVAFEQRFSSWQELKSQIGLVKIGFLNHWFPTYEEAKVYQQANGGFLFPYKKQFFVCEADYIMALGFKQNNQDWHAISYDWAKPKDEAAFKRLYREWMNIQEQQHA